MAQQPLEMILVRQLASYLAVPIWVTDQVGNLVYYNEPAEVLLGMSFEDAGPINAERIPDMFRATALDGTPLPAEELTLSVALSTRAPAHGSLRFSGLDGVSRAVEVTAIPITGQGERFLGAMVTFWEIGD